MPGVAVKTNLHLVLWTSLMPSTRSKCALVNVTLWWCAACMAMSAALRRSSKSPSMNEVAAALACQLEHLGNERVQVVHVSGALNHIADTLSTQPGCSAPVLL
eukprot:4190873-Amphidinium_carterae.1